MSISENEIKAALSTVVDPNTGKDVVSSRSVKNIQVSGADVAFDIELGYPAASQFGAIRASALTRGASGSMVAGEALITDVVRIRAFPLLPADLVVGGAILDVKTGRLQPMDI